MRGCSAPDGRYPSEGVSCRLARTEPAQAASNPPAAGDADDRRPPSGDSQAGQRGRRGTAATRVSTTRARSRSSRASRRSASVPACTSARPVSAACHHLVLARSSTTPSTRRSPATATRIDVTLLADGGVRGRRQRPRHPGRHRTRSRRSPAVEVVLTDPARRRQVRRRRLRGLRRPARRRRLASSTRCRAGSTSRSSGTATSTGRGYTDRRPGRSADEGRADRPTTAPRSRSGPTPTIFETIDYDYETLRTPASRRWPSSTRA